jgi:hypothetical protein
MGGFAITNYNGARVEISHRKNSPAAIAAIHLSPLKTLPVEFSTNDPFVTKPLPLRLCDPTWLECTLRNRQSPDDSVMYGLNFPAQNIDCF